MIKKILLVLFLIPISALAQINETNIQKTISGFITHNNKPLENVTILVDKTIRYAVSNEKGFYSIKAKPGEVLYYSYVGLDEV
ncbi:MAG: hypothetical protein ABF311_10595, partial [Polaribacter sp.]